MARNAFETNSTSSEKKPAVAPPATVAGGPLIHIKFPNFVTQFVLLAVGVGAVLVVTAIGLDILVPSSGAMKNIILASGLAIILAAFGSQANYQSKGIIIAGAAAIAFIFFIYLEYSRNHEVPKYVRGYIGSVRDGLTIVDISRQSHFLGQFSVGRPAYEFVAFKHDMDPVNDSQDVTVAIYEKSNPDNQDIFNVPFSCLSQWMGSGKNIAWYYDKYQRTLRENNPAGPIIAEREGNQGTSLVKVMPCGGPKLQVASADTMGLPGSVNVFASAAFAEDAAPFTPTADIPGLLSELQSEDPEIRRIARSTLSLVQTQDVPTLLQYARDNPGNDRAELGISVALTEMLRRDKTLRDKIALTGPDIDLLLGYATSGDRTLRVYSGEFLYDMGKPQIAKKALELLQARPASAPPEWDNALYNLLFVAQDGWAGLTGKEKADLRPHLSAIEKDLQSMPKTKMLRQQLQ